MLIMLLIYLLPIINNLSAITNLKTTSRFLFVHGNDFFWAVSGFFASFLLLLGTWYGPSLVLWHGHLVFTSFQYSLLVIFLFLFFVIFTVFTSVFYFSSREIYDFFNVIFSFLFFITFLFYANTLFTVIFFFEILASLVFLLIVVSSFSTSYSYKLDNFTNTNYFNLNLPVFTVNSLLYFF
jgi:hypothetical protein